MCVCFVMYLRCWSAPLLLLRMRGRSSPLLLWRWWLVLSPLLLLLRWRMLRRRLPVRGLVHCGSDSAQDHAKLLRRRRRLLLHRRRRRVSHWRRLRILLRRVGGRVLLGLETREKVVCNKVNKIKGKGRRGKC